MLKTIRNNPARSLATLVTVLAAGGAAVGSGADFTSQTANPGNAISSGTLVHTNTNGAGASSATIVTGSNLKPGDVKTGTVTIKNTGTLAGTFSLKEVNASSNFTSGVLNLKIEDTTTAGSPVTVYNGDFTGAATQAITGSYAAGASRTYTFTVTFAQGATNADQGKSATADFQWNETQA